jgi:hypothetical protein
MLEWKKDVTAVSQAIGSAAAFAAHYILSYYWPQK